MRSSIPLSAVKRKQPSFIALAGNSYFLHAWRYLPRCCEEKSEENEPVHSHRCISMLQPVRARTTGFALRSVKTCRWMRSLAEDDGIGRRAALITILLPFLPLPPPPCDAYPLIRAASGRSEHLARFFRFFCASRLRTTIGISRILGEIVESVSKRPANVQCDGLAIFIPTLTKILVTFSN
jgi:hypothetical protein